MRLTCTRGSIPVAAVTALLLASGNCLVGRAQCTQNHYVSENGPAAQHDCQPMATLTLLGPDQMSPAAQALVAARHADLVSAANFYGYAIEGPGWTYQQSVSPALQKHVLLSFTKADPARRGSHFMAVVPADNAERVQVVPTFVHGLRLFDPGWQKKGTYSVFNRLLQSEQGAGPITQYSEWINYGALYIALAGGVPAVPIDTDSVQATWDLAEKRATTPVIVVKKNGEVEIAFSDLSDPSHTESWKLSFDKHGRIQSADREARIPEKAKIMQTTKEPAATLPRTHSPLNP